MNRRKWLWRLCLLRIIAILFLLPTSLSIQNNNQSSLATNNNATETTHHGDKQNIEIMKILYMVTSGGKPRSGDRRFREQVEALILENVASLMENPKWHVDVYLILGYEQFSLEEEFRRKLWSINPNIQLRVWIHALPLFYACDEWKSSLKDPVGSGTSCRTRRERSGGSLSKGTIWAGTSQLARQHRLVVKDMLPEYDFFLAFEDDMLIRRDHVEYHMEWMAKLRRMLAESDREQESKATGTQELNRRQLERLRPGLLRVEVSQSDAPIDNESVIPVTDERISEASAMIDASRCCFRPEHIMSRTSMAPKPNMTSNDLLLWETAILGYGVRRLGDDWVGILPHAAAHLRYGDYWSGLALEMPEGERPPWGDPRLIAQSAGWMGSRREVLELDELCKGTFLPPFDTYEQDGLFRNNVEFWSGGIQLWGKGCKVVRFVDLQHFDRHLLYHTSNNKQRGIKKERIVPAKLLVAQLLVIKEAAELVLTV